MSQIEPPEEGSHFPFRSDEPLQRIPEVTIRLQSDGSAVFQNLGSYVGPHALRVLEIFTSPTSFRDAMAALQPAVRGSQDWMELSETIRGLCRLGIIDSVERSSRKASSPVGFDAPAAHISMLNDRARTEAYLRAIPEVVRSGDVVVEIGTGTGVLAMAAARAGARHVYTIEAGAIGRVAQALFEANGLGDRITLVSGRSSHATLPERGDVLLSEIIGSDPLDERVLESTRDAIGRLLAPDARFLPQSIRIYAVPVTIPAPLRAAYFFAESARSRWSEWYKMDFGPLDRGNAAGPLRIFQRPHTARDWVRVSEPVLVAEINLASRHPPRVEQEMRVVATRRATIHGLVSYFDLRLSSGVELSTDPSHVDEGSSWRLPVWLLPDPLEVEAGDALTLRYRYPSSSEARVTITR